MSSKGGTIKQKKENSHSITGLGTRGAAAKGGGGGKFTWGKEGDTGYDEDYSGRNDPNDPNYEDPNEGKVAAD